MSRIKHWGVAIGAAALVAVAAAATYQYATSEAAGPVSGGNAETMTAATSALPPAGVTDDNGGSGNASVAASPSDPRGGRGTFIVVLKEAPLATYKGTVAGISAPERQFDIRGRNRINVDGTESQQYVEYLELRQSQMETRMSTMMGRDVNPRMTMQHAINAMVVDLSASEAKAVQGMPEVRFVEAYREYELETDTGPALIGAPPVWTGTNPGSGGQQYRGEGTVLGIIDSGINFGSPSFAAVGPIDGYTHINPFGAGTYVGTCAAGGVDAGRCNDKLVGGYDFVCGAPANQCGVSGISEEPGFGDTNGHGSHTASTVAGNTRDAVFAGGPRRISGVAPRANIIAYDVCYTEISSGRGLCPNVSALAAIDQAISDGVVDAINYSIGGGASPWSEAVSLAFLDAVDAGIYVAASAGNSGPAANTLSHNEPWVASSAAAQHGRGAFGVAMSVTGPAPVPANLAPLIINEGTGGVSLTASLPGTTPLRISPNISTTNDGCTAGVPYPAGAFTGSIVVIRRGTCAFSEKTNNATVAGAIAVIIANNTTGVILPSVPGTTIPVFSVTQAEGDSLRNFGQANPTNTTAQITYPAVGIPNAPDVLAAFSSRGPAGTFNLLKPDATAPGVNVLAVLSGTTSVTGSEPLVGLLSGTSMASPHHAGSAMLIRQARPSWTVPEIKSALALTANQTVFTEDSVTLANPFARGSGRIQVDRAINAGLVMNETAANYFAANPAATPAGDPTTLNQPNLINRSCFPTCAFNRSFRSTRATTETWRVQLEGIRGAFPSFLTVAPGATISARFTIYGSIYPNNGNFNFGNVVLTSVPTDGSAPQVLRMPIAIAVQPPVISLPAGISMSMPTNGVNSVYFNIGNTGGSTLTYSFLNTGTAEGTLINTTGTTTGSGFRSTRYLDPTVALNNAQYSADDFVVTQTTQIRSLFVEGFTLVAPPLATVSPTLTWSIYPDAGGLPAGNPSSAPGAAVWTYTASSTSAGVTTGTLDDNILLNLAAAGQNVSLPPGRYWLVVNANSTFANRWVWFQSTVGSGLPGAAAITVSQTNTGAWTTQTATTFAGLAMRVNIDVPCGAPWIGGTYAASGSLARGTSRSALTVLYGTGLTPGNYSGIVCVQSNDPVTPRLSLPVSLTITP
jgi:Subtilase family/PA domain